MTQPPPDDFPAPAHSTVSSARPTAPLLGGATGVHPETFASALGAPTRPPDADHPLAAEVRRRREQARRRVVHLAASAVAAGGQTTVLVPTPGGPRAGFQWDLRRLNVGPMDYAAGGFPASIVVIAIISPQEEPGPPADDAGRVISMTTAYPAEGTWGRGEVTLLPGQFVRVLVTGLAGNTQVALGGQVEEVAIDTITAYGA